MEVLSPAECTGGREHAVLLPGDCPTGDGSLTSPPVYIAEGGREESNSCLRRRQGTRAAVLLQPLDPTTPGDLVHHEPAKLISGQQESVELASHPARVDDGEYMVAIPDQHERAQLCHGIVLTQSL